jgi:DNA-binding IclR family transcriptional regulator
LKILQTFTPEEPELTLSELGRRLDLSLSTMHRLLGTLQIHGFVEQNESNGKYRLGLALFKLGSLVQQNLDLRQLSQVPLRRLARQTNETAYLCVLDNNEALCVDRIEGQHQVRVLALDVGGRLPLNCGAAPRVLLAFLPNETINDLLEDGGLVQVTPASLSDPDEIWDDVRLTRERDYTFSVEDVIEGVAAIGAPIRDHTGEVVAALSIAGVLPHFEESRVPPLIKAVQEEARAISTSLGWAEALHAPNQAGG